MPQVQPTLEDTDDYYEKVTRWADEARARKDPPPYTLRREPSQLDLPLKSMEEAKKDEDTCPRCGNSLLRENFCQGCGLIRRNSR